MQVYKPTYKDKKTNQKNSVESMLLTLSTITKSDGDYLLSQTSEKVCLLQKKSSGCSLVTVGH